jgi:hypothetical protein
VIRSLAAAALAGAALACAAAPARADSRNEFWPELDAYVPIGERTRLFAAVAATRAEETQTAGAATQYQDLTAGVHLDVTLVPILRRELLGADWQRNRYLWMRIGYRYGRSIGDAEQDDRFRERRGIFEVTGRTPPLGDGLELVGRFRWDARDVNDRHSNRYRVRLTVEKALNLGGRVVVPFANAEAFYDTRFDTWNRQRYQAGAEIELDRQWRIEPSLVLQNDSRSKPAHVNALALALKYFF